MESNDKPTLNLKVVTISKCVPGYADQPGTGERIGILALMFRGKVEQPMMLSIAEIEKLLCLLIDVLRFHNIDLPAEVRDSIIFSPPPTDRPVRKTSCPATVPSRRATMPTGPIQSDEVAKFLTGLALVKTWPALVKHVGAKALPVSNPKPRRKKGKGRNGN